MCGLIGFSGKNNYHTKTLQMLIIWNSLERGEDSTGIYTPNNGSIKKLTKGSHFVLYPENHFKPDNLFIGHVRASTVGAKSVDNAHPFERENYVLAHNGTLQNYTDLAKKYDIDGTHTVDSDIVACCIAKQKNIPQIIQEIKGAAAFLIHDKDNPNILYAFTNGERPLFRGSNSTNDMYISSLAEPLFFANLTKIKEFKPNVLYTIVDGEIKNTKRIKNVPYTHPYAYVPVTGVTEDPYKDLRIRALNTTVIREPSIRNFDVSLIKGQYYICSGTDPYNKYKVMIKYYTSEHAFYLISLSKAMFNHYDVIKINDLVKPHTDIKDSYGNNAIKLHKDEILRVEKTWTDGDLTVKRLCTSNRSQTESLGYHRRHLFVKLSPEETLDALMEEEKYLKQTIIDIEVEDSVEIKPKDIVKDNTSDTTSKTHSCSVNYNSQQAINYDIETEVADVDSPNDQIALNLEDVETMFEDFESQLIDMEQELKDCDLDKLQRSLIAIDYSVVNWKNKLLP